MKYKKYIKNIFKNQKAQVGAPFEVLIAVILMGFVIIAGTFAIQNLSENMCIGNKTADLSELKTALRDVVLGSDLTFRTISFDSKSCYNNIYETTKLRTYNNTSKCSAYCKGSVNTCLLLEYTYDDGDMFKRPIPPICMDLPTAIEFGNNQECTADTDDWNAIQPSQGIVGNHNLYSDPDNITSGIYKIYKISIGGQTSQTKVCLLKKNKS